MNAILRTRGITRRFGATVALAGVDLEIRAGTLHALLGENGAGKSTLMHLVDGLILPDAGTMEFDGAPFAPRTPEDARRAGIGMVHQHFTTIGALTVWENIALAADWRLRDARARAEAALKARHVVLPLDARAEELSVGLRQQLELQKALATAPRLLLLDEPTGVLTPPEIVELFRVARAFTAAGNAVILITHRLDEALTEADAITVLRRGAVTLSWPGTEAGPRPDRETLIGAMLGGEGPDGSPWSTPAPVGGVVGRSGGVEVREGEVVGIAGIEGNGQRELFRGFGAAAFIPEDRTTEGLIPEFTVTENLALRPRSPDGGWRVDWRSERAGAAEVIASYQVKAPSPETATVALSGGNQQKVVVARALAGSPALIVAENPARGLDVGAATEIFGRLREAAARGAGVVFYSTDLDEILTWADRVLVIADGVVRAAPRGADRATVAAMMVPDRETR